MDGLFPGEPRALPPQSGVTIEVVRIGSPKPEPVRHAAGYERVVDFLRPFGLTPDPLLDTWTFAHVVRAHRDAFEADPELQRSAAVFLGNAFIREHPECVWTNDARGLGIETEGRGPVRWEGDQPRDVPGWAAIGVEGTVQAILDAGESRFREFASVVERWGPGSHGRPTAERPRFDSQPAGVAD